MVPQLRLVSTIAFAALVCIIRGQKKSYESPPTIRASACASALRTLCNQTEGKGPVCMACVAKNHAALVKAECYGPGKCTHEDCVGKFCGGSPSPAPPGAECWNSRGIRGVCGPDFSQCAPAPLRGSPFYHIGDETCGCSDPNAPFYDPIHKIYHLFYQDHVITNKPGKQHRGKVWGHVASADMVHWTRLPVALWPDHEFDNTNIFSGSATVDDTTGDIVVIYPGLWSRPINGKITNGRNLCIAIPSNRSDPMLTNWTKPVAINPITPPVSISSEWLSDPTTAWQTTDGWRFSTSRTSIVEAQVGLVYVCFFFFLYVFCVCLFVCAYARVCVCVFVCVCVNICACVNTCEMLLSVVIVFYDDMFGVCAFVEVCCVVCAVE